MAEHIDKIREQFTRQADAYVRMQQTTDEKSLRGLVMLSGAAPEHRVLDVACGPGFLTMALAQQCAAAVGLDATDEFLSRARTEAERRGLRNIEFRQGNAEQLPFADGSFDLVSCRAAFHHFPRPARILAEMRRVMRPGGRLLIADMLASENPAQAEYHNRIERLCDPTHVRALPLSAFHQLFADAGLEVVFEPQTQLHYDLEEWIGHGGPSPEVARQITALMEESAAEDRSGLSVRREDGRLRFSHTAAAFVLGRASAA